MARSWSAVHAWFLVALTVGCLLPPGSAQSSAAVPAVRAPAGSRYVLPVAGPAVVLTGFRAPDSPYGPGHRGVDLQSTAGAPVRAAGAGFVVQAGPVAGRGVVSVAHPGGIRTTYEPVLARVRPGEVIKAGQLIGIVQPGHPACSPATCLHWGARLPDGSYLDPLGLLGRLRVRLLPWRPAGPGHARG